jgi:hypothetical protein
MSSLYEPILKRLDESVGPGGHGLGRYVTGEIELKLSRMPAESQEALRRCLPHIDNAIELACPAAMLPGVGYGAALNAGDVLIVCANLTSYVAFGGRMPRKLLRLDTPCPDLMASFWRGVSRGIDAANTKKAERASKLTLIAHAMFARMGQDGVRKLRQLTNRLRKQQAPYVMTVVGLAGYDQEREQVAGLFMILPLPAIGESMTDAAQASPRAAGGRRNAGVVKHFPPRIYKSI